MKQNYTVQGGVIRIPIPRIMDSDICPVWAIYHAFSFTQDSPANSQAFYWIHPVHTSLQAFTYNLFMNKLRDALNASGLPGKEYGTHSSTRGGASYAFQAGIPLELKIKILGDWKSNAVLLYLTVPLNIRIKASQLISQHISHP